MRNSPSVAFAGYSIPHPAKPVLQLRIQTGRANYMVPQSFENLDDADEVPTSKSKTRTSTTDTDGDLTATGALAQGLNDLTAMFTHISTVLHDQLVAYSAE
jgi:DNA-directed RNA polymerase subunit L